MTVKLSQFCLWVILFVSLSACASPATPLTGETPIPTRLSFTPIPPSVTPTFTFPTASPTPTKPVFPTITPDAVQVEHWNEYEEALAKVFFNSYYQPEEVVCEWEILGRAVQEVYVWGYCASTYAVGNSGGSIPAVIYLKEDGSVDRAEIPGSGTSYGPDIQRMFPAELHQRIFDHRVALEAMRDRLRWRQGHPNEPPWVILQSLSTKPTPVVMPWGTPDPVQAERWEEYQAAIAEQLSYGAPDTTLCEWEFLGRAGNEVYVWAICGEVNEGRIGLEDVFRIDVNDDGSIQNALLHGVVIYPMLPPEAREKYFSGSIHFQELVDHLRWRFTAPSEPPLIILKATP